MQYRMKTHQLNQDQIVALLAKIQTASLATLNMDGCPYVTPVHFLYHDHAIYIHGLPKGQKVNNIKANPKVSIAAYEMGELLLDPNGKPCDTNTQYSSVIIIGTAGLLEDTEQKKIILKMIVEKYTPQLSNIQLPDNMIKGTAVIKIVIDEITGKYWGA